MASENAAVREGVALCLVRLQTESKIALARVGNEATTISRMNCQDPNARLSCQVAVDNTLQDTTISILDDY
jgi:ferredoxin